MEIPLWKALHISFEDQRPKLISMRLFSTVRVHPLVEVVGDIVCGIQSSRILEVQELEFASQALQPAPALDLHLPACCCDASRCGSSQSSLNIKISHKSL